MQEYLIFNFIILCVKPKNIEEVGKLLSKVIVSNQTIISFMAGVKIEKLKKYLIPIIQYLE